MSDRSQVSPEAARVWNSYLNMRGEIDVHPIKLQHHKGMSPPHMGSADKTGEDALRYRYTKEVAMINRLDRMGKLVRLYK